MKKIDILHQTKLHTYAGAFVGLLAGITYSFGGFFVDLFTTGLNAGTAMAFGALIGMPAIFAIFGFAIGIVYALIYNIVLRRFLSDKK